LTITLKSRAPRSEQVEHSCTQPRGPDRAQVHASFDAERRPAPVIGLEGLWHGVNRRKGRTGQRTMPGGVGAALSRKGATSTTATADEPRPAPGRRRRGRRQIRCGRVLRRGSSVPPHALCRHLGLRPPPPSAETSRGLFRRPTPLVGRRAPVGQRACLPDVRGARGLAGPVCNRPTAAGPLRLPRGWRDTPSASIPEPRAIRGKAFRMFDSLQV